MTRRSYQQFCGLASALDSVGERWTLLIVRDLMAGPKRYTDLAASLHGIGTSLLAERVKQLDADGVIARRELPPPAASTVYELTDAGWELADALVPLAIWGARHQLDSDRTPDQHFQPEWSLTVFARLIASREPEGSGVYDFTIDGESVHIIHAGSSTTVTRGPAPGGADATVTGDSGTVAGVVAGRLLVADALTAGSLAIEGTDTAMNTLVAAIPRMADRPN
ncbi:ArsR family transcriptional regulator [Rhodococcus sp. 06-235-1A]|uniref:winged helix-turn-helix transcriptional regulator n=1 Tax=Rhodococcus sp. 06-235-1A TaxID=2022508 RepID=UPI000B9B6BFC|nr:winged helix-turn-helix transcriptional regulator [Rhodococcus sp. 06-235-1A]OZD10460.1 ArsR family transcriptional regulator [Rhodococcus sp. 06-235-1A]